MTAFEKAFSSGLDQIIEYLSEHTWNSIIPAFFIAGAIAVFLSKDRVLKYFSPDTRPHVSYGIASISGCILAVCSCVIIPLFASIRKRGAGIGPATTFLYSGPAINIMAIALTARVLGFEVGVARAIMAVSMSIVIGIVMSLIFKNEKRPLPAGRASSKLGTGGKKQLAIFSILLAILVIGTSSIPLSIKIISMATLSFMTGIFAMHWVDREDLKIWMLETYSLFKMIFPLLVVGVFFAGMIKELIPPEYIIDYVGTNSIFSNLTASVMGALMYFATLTEIPIVESLTTLGMNKGPELSLLLAGPALSLPNMLAIRRIMGTKKTITYVFLVVLFATVSGSIYGSLS